MAEGGPRSRNRFVKNPVFGILHDARYNGMYAGIQE